MAEPLSKHNGRYQVVLFVLQHYSESRYLITLKIDVLIEPFTVKWSTLHDLKRRKFIGNLKATFLRNLDPYLIITKLQRAFDYFLLEYLVENFGCDQVFETFDGLWNFTRPSMIKPLGELNGRNVFQAFFDQQCIDSLFFEEELKGLARIRVLCKDAKDRWLS